MSSVLATQGAANTLGRVLVGLLADAFPRKKVLILTVCMLSVASASAGLAAAPGVANAHVFVAIAGGLGGAMISIQPAITIDAIGMRFLPLAQGAFNCVQAPFALAGAPIGARIAAAAGATSKIWWFMAAAFAMACLWALLLDLGITGGGKRAACLKRREGEGEGEGQGRPFT